MTLRVPVERAFVNVQVVRRPDSIVIPLTVLPVRLPVDAPPCLVQAALLRFQPLGTVSATEPVLVKPRARFPELPEPVMVTGFPPLGVGETVKLKTWVVVPATL